MSQEEIFLGTQKGQHLFFCVEVVLRHPCLDQVSDRDVQRKNKDLLFTPKHLQSKDSSRRLHQLPCGREKLIPETQIA